MKRIVSLVLAVSMILSCFVSVFAASTYSDLTGENAKYASAVAALSELKVGDWAVIQGYTDGTFGPQKEVTRAELAKMLVVCLGLGEEVDSLAGKTVFSDVPYTYWGAGFINAAAQSKIIVGYPDGEFKPEKTVTYAEAFTMALRALGYGNVADFEGTWPTAYIQKAVELRLNKDMDAYKTDAAALRGNIAIMLWNMLRTPMWRVYEESEGTGMTLANTGEEMLNVKFPDYRYYSKTYVESVDVSDNEDVKVTLEDAEKDDNNKWVDATYSIENVDLTRIVPGQKVSALVKDYKDPDKAVFVSLVAENPMVEGFVSDLKIGDAKTTFKVDGTEYRFDTENFNEPLDLDSYVVFEADGKKVAKHDGEFVINYLPTGGIYAETANVLKKNIKEDDLVIIDGVWSTRDDVELGSIITEIDMDNNGDYWVATAPGTEPVEFDLVSDGTMNWKDEKVDVYYLLTDNGKERIFLDDFEAYEGKDNDKAIEPVAGENGKLNVKRADNDYHGDDVVVLYNYLGVPMRIHFGDVEKSSKMGHFYAVVSNGLYGADDKREGTIYQIDLVDQEGEEVTRSTVRTAYIDGDVENGDVYADEVPTYVWVKDDEDDSEAIATLIQLYDGLSEEKDEKYTDNNMITAVKNGAILEKKDSKWQLETTAGSVVFASSTIPFFEATAQKNDNKVVTGFEVTVGTRGDYEDLEIPEGTLVAYKKADDGTLKAKYVFVAGEAEGTKKQFGLIDEDGISYTEETVTIDGQEYKLSDESAGGAKGEDAVFFTTNKDGSKAKIAEVFDTSDLDNAYIRMPYEDDAEEEDADYIPTDSEDISLDDSNADYKKHKKYDVYKVTVSEDPDTRKIVIDSVDKQATQGHTGLANASRTYDRIIIRESDRVILVFTKFAKDDATEEGYFVDAEAKPTATPTPTVEPTPTDAPKFTVSYDWSGDAVEGYELPSGEEFESGDICKPEAIEIEGYEVTLDPADPFEVTEDTVIYVTATAITEPPMMYEVTYAWSGDPVEGYELPSGEEVEAGTTYTPEEIVIEGYDVTYPADPFEVTEDTVIYVTAVATQPQEFTVSYAFAEGTPAWLVNMSGDILPAAESSTEPLYVVAINDLIVNSGDEFAEAIEAGESSGDTWTFSTEPAAETELTASTEVIVTASKEQV